MNSQAGFMIIENRKCKFDLDSQADFKLNVTIIGYVATW